ncbi:MAG: fibrinogen-like YCDxxxxGGGW domain-containing protein [Candidatus Gracilibacteria bacterium]|nr:fibrinogen-like YCDxxxxGGGW domain-containing protein [Candidatus Gracilibacteria bacterium]
MDKDKIKVKKNQKNGFTLVELIVVITILAILGTIAFITLNGYSQQSRDSARISDISSLKTSLELFQIEAGKYPLPTDGIDVTYSGAVVWNQGTFGESVQTNIDKLDRIPLDPLTNSNYTYSVTQKRNEYELAGIVEGDILGMNNEQGIMNKVVSQTNAGTTEATAYVTGNYNSLMNKTASGETCYVLSLPTIIASDVETSNKIEDIVTENKLVYNGFKNLPNSFRTSKFKLNGGFEFNTSKLLSYNGSCQNLENNLGEQMKLIAGLQLGYSGTVLDPREDGIVSNKGGTNKLSDLYNIYLGTNLDNVLTYLDTPNNGPLSLTGITTLSGSAFKPDTTTIKNIELFINNTGLVGKTSSTSSKTTNVYTTQEVKSCGVKYFNIGTDVTETQLALYHDGWNNPDANVRKGNRIAAANRYCSIYGCSPNAQNCVGYQPGKGFNGGGTYIESTNQIMCVGGSDTKDGELRVIPTGAMNLWNISQTDAACQSECSGAGFDNGVSVERNTSNIGCSCWDDCAGNSCKNDIASPLFIGTKANCNAGVVSTNKNHLNCSTNFIGYSSKTGDTALYVGTKAYCNAGVLTTNPNHLNCPTQLVGYAKSTGDTQLYVGTQNGCNAGVVTTNPNHLNCTTTSIGYLSTSCAILQGNVPIVCNDGETKIRGQCTDSYNDNVLLYLPMTGTDGSTAFTDHSIYNRTVSRSGNSSIKTNITDPFGGNSGVGYFDGNGDYLTTAISGIGANDFTLETFIYRTQNVVDIDVVAEFDGTINFEVRGGNQSFGLWVNGTYITTPNVMSLNTWHHVAYTKQGSTRRVFIDGIQRTSTTKSMTLGNMNLNIGDDPSVTHQNRDFAGYMSNFRVTNGLARYTTTFTPPNRPFAQRLNMTGGYFSGYGTTSSSWKKANGDSLKSCQEYNLQATTYNDGLNRGTGTCGNGSQECLYDGVYSIDPDGAGGNAPFNVYCGMTLSIDGKIGGWTLMATKNDTDRNAIIANWGTTLNNSTANSNNLYKGNWSDLSYNYMVYDIANYNYKFIFDMTGMSNTTKDYSKDAIFLNYGDMYDSGKTLTCKSINNGNTYPHCGSYTSTNRYRWKGLVGDPGYPWCRFYSPPDGGQGTGGCAASPANNKGRIWVR